MIVRTKNNDYYFSDNQKDILLLPPTLSNIIENEGNLTLDCTESDSVDYYKGKYKLLKESGYLDSLEVDEYEFLTKDLLEKGLANSRHIIFETTEECNLRCKYCGYSEIYNTFEERGKQKLSFFKAKLFLDYMLKKWNSKQNASFNTQITISFYGGEPLLNFNFIEQVVNYVSNWRLENNFIKFSMTTNGTLLDRYMDFLVKWDFSLFVSIDGNEYHNSFRTYANGKNSYEKVYNNISLIKRMYPSYFVRKVEFNSVFHKRSSYLEVSNFFKKEFGKSPLFLALNTFGVVDEKKDEFKKLYKNPVETLNRESECNPNLKEQFSSANINLISILNCYNNNIFSDYNALLYDMKYGRLPTGTCIPFQHKIYISTSGQILPCEKIGSNFTMGKITDKEVRIDYDEIVKFYNDKFSTVISNLCKHCRNRFCKSCMFTMLEKEGKIHCGKFLSEKGFSQYIASIMEELEDNVGIQDKMWKNLKKK